MVLAVLAFELYNEGVLVVVFGNLRVLDNFGLVYIRVGLGAIGNKILFIQFLNLAFQFVNMGLFPISHRAVIGIHILTIAAYIENDLLVLQEWAMAFDEFH